MQVLVTLLAATFSLPAEPQLACTSSLPSKPTTTPSAASTAAAAPAATSLASRPSPASHLFSFLRARSSDAMAAAPGEMRGGRGWADAAEAASVGAEAEVGRGGGCHALGGPESEEESEVRAAEQLGVDVLHLITAVVQTALQVN